MNSQISTKSSFAGCEIWSFTLRDACGPSPGLPWRLPHPIPKDVPGYAAANHALIHRHITENLGVEFLLDVENHHNFAWKEVHFGKEVIVHRKGATPAGEGVFGIIPGSMATPGFLVSGKGNVDSLNSASHGAGRAMSRTRANQTLSWHDANALLRDRGVTLISAGLDEVPFAYKDIETVMVAQTDLVSVLARFDPKLVKMCPSGERPED